MTNAAPFSLASAHLASRAGGADELQAERACPLAGDEADAAGSGVEEHEVAGLAALPADGVRFSRYCAVRPLSIIAAPVSKSIASGRRTTVFAGITRSVL